MSVENTGGRVYRDRVLKVITDRPGDVVFRDDIADAIPELSGDQISAAVQRIKADPRGTIGKDIEVVVQARAWRYVPNSKIRQAARAGKPALVTLSGEGRRVKGTPLTTAIRTYFVMNPNRPIFMDELHEMMTVEGEVLDREKLRVGVANARQHQQVFRSNLVVVVPGNAWQYVPPADNEANVVKPPPTVVDLLTKPAPVAATPVPARPMTPSKPAEQTELMMVEKMGQLNDGTLLVRDTTDKSLYRLSPM